MLNGAFWGKTGLISLRNAKWEGWGESVRAEDCYAYGEEGWVRVFFEGVFGVRMLDYVDVWDEVYT